MKFLVTLFDGFEFSFGDPLRGAGGAFPAELRKLFADIKQLNFEDTHSIGGAEHGADIVRIVDVLHDDREIRLAPAQYFVHALFAPFGHHGAAISAPAAADCSLVGSFLVCSTPMATMTSAAPQLCTRVSDSPTNRNAVRIATTGSNDAVMIAREGVRNRIPEKYNACGIATETMANTKKTPHVLAE